jgi:hypothetical protein
VRSLSIRWLLLILAAEILASFAVWSGTPTDWRGEPLHFWYFETLRLRYWCGFGLLFAGLWVIGSLGLRRFSPTVIPAVLAALCSLGTEVMTSTYFWRSLSWNQASCLGWSYFRGYFSDHLVSWVVVLVISGLCGWYLRHREHRSRTAAPLTKPSPNKGTPQPTSFQLWVRWRSDFRVLMRSTKGEGPLKNP